VRAFPRPRVAVLTTGDEVVEPPQTPGPGQIRNSHGQMLAGQVARAGALPQYLGIARDRPESLRPLVSEGLRAPVLILSGGVSAGVADLVPAVLEELGVTAHFHKVAMKPGKPVFFGTRPAKPQAAALVFGLPGNPVSAFVCFELFVRPALRRLMGHADPGPRVVSAVLAEDFAYRTDRLTYHPARLDSRDGQWQARPVPWFGSPDLRGLTRANAFVVFPAGDHRHRAGQRVDVLCPED
jgi:molybdopterin molybdotransferase